MQGKSLWIFLLGVNFILQSTFLIYIRMQFFAKSVFYAIMPPEISSWWWYYVASLSLCLAMLDSDEERVAFELL